MADHRGQQSKLAREIDTLQRGVVVQVTLIEAVYLPGRCLHAVFTLAGGLLVSVDCTTQRSFWPFAQYIRRWLDGEAC